MARTIRKSKSSDRVMKDWRRDAQARLERREREAEIQTETMQHWANMLRDDNGKVMR